MTSQPTDPAFEPQSNEQQVAIRALLRWYRDMGIDVGIQKEPVNSFELPEATLYRENRTQAATSSSDSTRSDQGSVIDNKARAHPPPSSSQPVTMRPTTGVLKPDTSMPSTQEAIEMARTAAAACDTIKALSMAVAAFNACPLKKGARSTVFGTGVQDAPLLVLGEAPGQDEDRLGEPFVGRAGQLLDKMLTSIGHSRTENAYISNVIYWRPPGNRNPSESETMICNPFVERLITIMQPKVVILAGAIPFKAVLGKTGIMKTRGKWQTWNDGTHDIDVMPTFHPAYLLRNPDAKRYVWQDLKAVRDKLGAMD